MKEGIIGPFDFLFCEKCNRHVGDKWYFYHKLKRYTTMTPDQRQSPVLRVKRIPHCFECDTALIQKYVTIECNVEAHA